MITLDDIIAAGKELPPAIVRTPLLFSEPLSNQFRCALFLKTENLQITGSYKARAAFTILNRLTPAQKKKGAAISSSGNFAGAFAYMGRLLNIPTVVVMMQKTAPFKIERTQQYGAEVVLCENRFAARWETLDRLQAERGVSAINTFESPQVIIGHGVIGLEILADLPNADVILVPISSGGLLAGVALAAKETNPKVNVIGVQPAGSNAMYLSFHSGKLQSIDQVNTICDALVATKPGALPFALVQKYVDDVVLVSDDAVRQATTLLFEHGKLVVEPSGAVGVAALLSGKVAAAGKRVVALLSGGNVSRENFRSFL